MAEFVITSFGLLGRLTQSKIEKSDSKRVETCARTQREITKAQIGIKQG